MDQQNSDTGRPVPGKNAADAPGKAHKHCRNFKDTKPSIVQAEELLRPSASQLAAAWKAIVIEERRQVERVPDRPKPEDFYQPVAQSFRAEPDRSNDPVLEHLQSLALAEETWLDLGAGGGRYAVPMSQHLARVIAIEPSEGMREVLTASINENRIENIEIFPERWPGPSDAPIADVGMIANVSYDIEEIGLFLDQLEAHSRRLCIAILFDRSPPAYFAPLWEKVHGEPRILLPGAGELIALLLARGTLPEVQVFDPPQRTFPDLETLHQQARRPLWVLEGSEADKRLGQAVKELAVSVDSPPEATTRDLGSGRRPPLAKPGCFTLTDRPRQLAILSWQPKSPTLSRG